MFLSLIIYACFTLYRLFHHIPWMDEGLAWNIAKYLNLTEIFEASKSEGHTFIWYFILKPFAVNDFWYPYSLLLINYIFCFSAIVILWRYAKFNNIIKILITFSFPFLSVYSVVARCYSLGILGLFLLAALYKDRLKRPVIYALLILFTGNICAMTMIGASAFAFIFVLDLIKMLKTDCKKTIIPALILFFTLMLVITQFHEHSTPLFFKKFIFSVQMHKFFFLRYKYMIFQYLSYFVIPAAVISFVYYLSDNKRCLFFFLYCWSCLFAFFYFIYAAQEYHHYFFYIYLIIAYWIYRSDNPERNIKKDKVFAVIISVLLVFICFKTTANKIMFISKADEIAKKIEQIKDISEKTIYTTEREMADVLPYINRNKVKIKRFEGNDLFSAKELSVLTTKDFKTLDIKYDSTDDKLFLVFYYELNEYNWKYYDFVPVKRMNRYVLCKAVPKEQ